MEIKNMSSQSAVRYVMNNTKFQSYYAVAKELGIQPIQVSNYDKGLRRMSKTTAQKFFDRFRITISDVHKSQGRAYEWL